MVSMLHVLARYELFKRTMAVPFVSSPPPAVSAIVLKSPHHSVKMATIAQVYESPVFVWLHRDLDKVVGSTCSMNATVQECASVSYETKRSIGRRTLLTLSAAMDKAVDDRLALEAEAAQAVENRAQQSNTRSSKRNEGEDKRNEREDKRGNTSNPRPRVVQFVDIFHEELRQQPLDAVQKVYGTLGIDVSATFIDRLAKDTEERGRKRNSGGKGGEKGGKGGKGGGGGQHRYGLHEFGLTSEEVAQAFAKYLVMVERIKSNPNS